MPGLIHAKITINDEVESEQTIVYDQYTLDGLNKTFAIDVHGVSVEVELDLSFDPPLAPMVALKDPNDHAN